MVHLNLYIFERLVTKRDKGKVVFKKS